MLQSMGSQKVRHDLATGQQHLLIAAVESKSTKGDGR